MSDPNDFFDNSGNVYASDANLGAYEDYVDAINRGIRSDNPANISIVDVGLKALTMLTIKPVGSNMIMEGVEGAVMAFVKDLVDGDMAAVSRRLDDVDNLVANLLLYLTARGVSKEAITQLQIGYYDYNGKFIPDYTLMYQFSYALKNQLSDTVWAGYSSKYTGRYYDIKSGVFKTDEGVEYALRTWSYSKNGNTKDSPQSGGWMRSKWGNYYIRKNLY